jgi:nucleoside-diphosphate-sugar epimerase
MTEDKNRKRLVRARMAETGQTYTQARADLLGGGSPAAVVGERSTAAGAMPRDARIFVTGHRGLVGSALLRRLQADGYTRILTATRDQVDLRDQAAVNYWFRANRPDYVFLVAGTVGGILANTSRPAEFLYDNLLIHGTVVEASHRYGVQKLLYLGSSCVYPRDARQPIREDQLLSGPLEPTNDAYALAKIAGIRLCQAYRAQYPRRADLRPDPTRRHAPQGPRRFAHSRARMAAHDRAPRRPRLNLRLVPGSAPRPRT